MLPRPIHVGSLFAIGTIKHSELPEEQQIYKGRIVFQGSNVKDQSGMQAMFQQLSSSPASMSAGRIMFHMGVYRETSRNSAMLLKLTYKLT